MNSFGSLILTFIILSLVWGFPILMGGLLFGSLFASGMLLMGVYCTLLGIVAKLIQRRN